MKYVNDERGAVYPLAGALILALLAMGGLLIDGAMAVYQYTNLTSAVDAAAIATLDAYDEEIWQEEGEVEIDQDSAVQKANQYLSMNMDGASIRPPVEVDGTQVTVRAEATVPLFFMSMFGQSDFTIEAMARASLDDTVDEDEEEDD